MGALMAGDDTRPHSRACGIWQHSHGQQCHRSCQTCGGRDEALPQDDFEPPSWREQIESLLETRDAEVDELKRKVRNLQVSLREAFVQVDYHRDQHAALVQAPVLTPTAKADTEAAFQRGLAHARTNMGGSMYALNRDGILALGAASTSLAMAQIQIDEAVKTLSEDLPATDPGQD
jgi:hypothetical protein